MDRKRIIYVWKSPYPWDVRVEKICNSLSKEYEVIILARWGGETKKEEQIGNLTIRRVGFQKKSAYSTPLSFNPIWKSELKKAINDFKPNLLIVREIMLGSLVGKLGRKYNIPTIMDMAENYPALMKLWNKYNSSPFKRIITRWLDIPEKVEESAVSLIDAIIVVCKEQIERLTEVYQFPNSKIAIVKNTPVFSENVKPSNKPEGKIVFLHHGWLTEEKKIDLFIKSFIQIYKNNEKYELVIAGSGNCLEECKELSEGAKNIIFFGEYNYKDLDVIISNSTIGILPYEENDFNNYTIHNKLFDYFALSKPVLVSKAKPIARIVKATNSGYVIDCSTSESITEELRSIDFSNLDEIGSNAYKAYKERYNWSEDEKILLKFVSEII